MHCHCFKIQNERSQSWLDPILPLLRAALRLHPDNRSERSQSPILSPLRAARTMLNVATMLAAGSSIVTIGRAAVDSWPAAAALATTSTYNMLFLGTQVDKLRDERYSLVYVVWEDNYLLLSPARRDRAIIAIRRYVLITLIVCSMILILVLCRLDDDIRDCHNRYLALSALGWLQYTTEVYNLYMAVRALLKRLDEVRRDIEVRRRYI
jgi:hypothetical protein